MEHRSAITLKPFDVISIPGLGTKIIGAIHQTSHYRYQIRLDEKFTESVTVEVDISNGEQRTPERHDGPWRPAGMDNSIADLQTSDQIYRAMGTTEPAFLAGLEGKPFPFEPDTDAGIPPETPRP